MNKLIQIVPVVLATSITLAGVPAHAGQIEPGDRVLVIAPSASDVYVGHAEGEVIELTDDQAKVKLDDIDVRPWNESSVGELLFKHDAGDIVNVNSDHVEPYSEERLQRKKDKWAMSVLLEPDQGAPDYGDPIERQKESLEYLRMQLDERDIELEDVPAVAAEMEMSERVIAHIEQYPDMSASEALDQDPGFVSRNAFEVAEEYDFLEQARELFLADKLRNPSTDRRSRKLNLWHKDPDSEEELDGFVPVPTPVQLVLSVPLGELITQIEEYGPDDETTREQAALLVDHFDGAHQEGSREEQIDSLIEEVDGLRN